MMIWECMYTSSGSSDGDSRFSSGVKQGLGETSPAHLPQTHLHKQGDGVESEDLHAVHGIPGKDVQGSSAAFHNLLHPHTVLHEKSHWGIATVSLGSGKPPVEFGKRIRDSSPGHAGKEGPHLAMTRAYGEFSQAAASVWGFSRGTTGTRESWGLRASHRRAEETSPRRVSGT